MKKLSIVGLVGLLAAIGCGDSKTEGRKLDGEVDVASFAAGKCGADNDSGEGGTIAKQNDVMYDTDPEIGSEPECVQAWRDKSGLLKLKLIDLHGNCATDWTARAHVPSEGKLNILLHNSECSMAKCTCPFDLDLEVDVTQLSPTLELEVSEESCDGTLSERVRKLEVEVGGEARCFPKPE